MAGDEVRIILFNVKNINTKDGTAVSNGLRVSGDNIVSEGDETLTFSDRSEETNSSSEMVALGCVGEVSD